MLAAALALGVALVEAAYALAFRDELTDLPGRRALGSLLASLRPPYSVAVVDVDRFKTFNDRYGHDVGDQVLRMVAARLGAVGGGGRAFRSGGEEFTIVFPGTTAEEAMPHLEAVRRAVAESKFVLRGKLRSGNKKGPAKRGRASAAGRQLRVTVSIGVARCTDRHTSADQVVKSADQAMYRAKQSGRNRVVA
jgi:GGDEF domain-containing protein